MNRFASAAHLALVGALVVVAIDPVVQISCSPAISSCGSSPSKIVLHCLVEALVDVGVDLRNQIVAAVEIQEHVLHWRLFQRIGLLQLLD
jgi:hypothetical protein